MHEIIVAPMVEHKFNRVVQAIEQRLQLLDKVPRVRINAWLKKLKDEISSNATWQRNRNCYARLLLEQLRAGCLEVPFNSMPPEGALPTLPSYLTYRFISPPKQLTSTFDNMDVADGCRSAESACMPMNRPHSAGRVTAVDDRSLMHPLPSSGAHNCWRVGGAPTSPPGWPTSTQQASSTSPCQQQQQQWILGSPCAAMTAGVMRRGYSSGSTTSSPQQQRPRSPGAAGLMDAAAAVAAEMEAEREQSSRINNRLRFAEDKLLQQEAELVRLQGAAAATRRRIKSATTATLQELLDRYGSAAAAAWSPSHTPAGSGTPLADAVYKPVWQLLSGLQSVLDSCDKEEQHWLRAQGAAAAAALQACYDAQASMACDHTGTPTGSGLAPAAPQGATQQTVPVKDESQLASDGAAAAAAEAAVLQHSLQVLIKLQQQAAQLVGGLADMKQQATAAAGARSGVTGADVAAATAKLLKSMLKPLRREHKEVNKLRMRMEAAARATVEAAAAGSAAAGAASDALFRLQAELQQHHAASDSSSSDSDSDADTDISSVAYTTQRQQTDLQQRLKDQQRVLAAAEHQQQQQDARLSRLQSATELLMQLDKLSAKLQAQLQDARHRLVELAGSSHQQEASGAAITMHTPLHMHHHDNGMTAAATAGIAASMSAGTRAYHASVTSLLSSLDTLLAAAADALAAAAAGSTGAIGTSSRVSIQQQQQGVVGSLSQSRSSPCLSLSSALQTGPTPTGRSSMSAVAGASSSIVGGQLFGRTLSGRLGDAGLAGTWSERAAAPAGMTGDLARAPASGGASLLSRNTSMQAAAPGMGTGDVYDAATHYRIGAAAATGAGGGAGSPLAAATAAAAAAVPLGSPRGPGYSNKSSFTEQLQAAVGGLALNRATAAAGGGGGGGEGRSDAAGSGGGEAAVEAVHAQLAGLSRQASRLSQRASQILSSSTTTTPAHPTTSVPPPSTATAAVAAPSAAAAVGGGGGRSLLPGGSSSSVRSLLQRGASGGLVSPLSAPSSPRSSMRAAAGELAGTLTAATAAGPAGGSNGSSSSLSPRARSGSLLSPAVQSALLKVGSNAASMGAARLPGSSSSNLLLGGRGVLTSQGPGTLTSTVAALAGNSSSSVLKGSGGSLLSAAPTSNIAAISSRLQSLATAGK